MKELSAEILHQTVESAKTFHAERREFQRLPFRFKVKIIPFDDNSCLEPISVWTKDICPGGIGLICQIEIREGRKFIIRLSRHDDVPIFMLCTVRNCTKLATNVYGVGASFVEVVESKKAATPGNNEEVPGPVPFKYVTPTGTAFTDEVRRISDAILS